MYEDLLSVVAGGMPFGSSSTMADEKEQSTTEAGNVVGESKVPPPALPSVTEGIVSSDENGDVSQRRLARTREVKVLLSPIMQRMKASLAKIHDLEESLNRSKHLISSEEEHQSVGGSSCSSSRVHRASRRLLKNSMRMLKSKLTALQQMEENLRLSEDRQQHLLHHVLQVTSSSPSLKHIYATISPSIQVPLKVTQEDPGVDGYSKVQPSGQGQDNAQSSVEMELHCLRAELRNMEQLKEDLEATRKQCSLLEDDLAQRQTKINQKAIQCDELECEVEQLKAMCDDLIKNLNTQEQRNENLVQQIKLGSPASQNHHRDYQTQGSTSSSTAPESDSSSLDSSCSYQGSQECGEEEPSEDLSLDQQPRDEEVSTPLFRLQKLASSVFSKSPELSAPTRRNDADTRHPVKSHAVQSLPKNVEPSSITVFTNDVPGGNVGGGQGEFSTIDGLVAKIEAIDQENADLIQSKEEMMQKFHDMLQTNSRQAARIAQLERQLQQYEKRPNQSSQTIANKEDRHKESGQWNQILKTKSADDVDKSKKATSPSFFRQLLQSSDAKQLKALLEGNGSSNTNASSEKSVEAKIGRPTKGVADNSTFPSGSKADVEAPHQGDVSHALTQQQHIPFGQLASVAE